MGAAKHIIHSQRAFDTENKNIKLGMHNMLHIPYLLAVHLLVSFQLVGRNEPFHANITAVRPEASVHLCVPLQLVRLTKTTK